MEANKKRVAVVNSRANKGMNFTSLSIRPSLLKRCYTSLQNEVVRMNIAVMVDVETDLWIA